MSAKSTKTDMAQLRRKRDEDIDTSDIPEMGAEFWADAELVMPVQKNSFTLRIDSDVLAFFRGMGKGYQTRMNSILRTYMAAHVATPRQKPKRRS